MPASQGPNIGIWGGYASAESGWTNQYNQDAAALDFWVQPSVLDRSLTVPPASPANGAAYIVATGATGVWAGKAGQVAVFRTNLNAWEFYAPKNGWQVVIVSEGTWGTMSTYKGGSWSPGLALT